MTVHCWADLFDGLEVGTAEYFAALEKYPCGASCMLPDGHRGPHEWTPDDQITVTFPPAEGRP